MVNHAARELRRLLLLNSHRGFLEVIPLGRQLKYFSKFQEAIIEKWGSVQANKYISDAIYLISISNNDYMSGYFSVVKLREKYTPQDFIALIVGEIVRACEFLHAKGARKFVVVALGPYSKK
ncbi:unnamed protein product [Calypogeia fissa]